MQMPSNYVDMDATDLEYDGGGWQLNVGSLLVLAGVIGIIGAFCMPTLIGGIAVAALSVGGIAGGFFLGSSDPSVSGGTTPANDTKTI